MVIMAGPLPPAVGGMASVLGTLNNSSLSHRVNLCLFETGKTTPEGRPLWQGISTRLRLLYRWWCQMGQTPRPIAHIHTCSGFTYFLDGLLLLLAKWRGAPAILHIHGGRFDAFLDSLNLPLASVARWLAKQSDVVVVLSDDWRRRLSERLPAARFAVVANGVPAFPSALKQKNATTTRFLFLGTISVGKGIPVLIEAASKSRLPWSLDLAGNEDQPGFMASTGELIKQLGLSERIRLLGPVVGEAKNRLLQDADGFVLPSLAEGLPMALLEAMAARLPVVVTTVGAMPEVVRDDVEGYLVPPEDATALADALDRLAADPALRHRLGQAASVSCDRAYGIERMVETLADLYKTLPAGRPL